MIRNLDDLHEFLAVMREECLSAAGLLLKVARPP